MIREMSAQVLRSAGYWVTTAESSEAARHCIQEQSFELMITDNQMPGVPGLAFVRGLRAAQIHLPILFISGGMSDELIQDESLQPAAALPKPFSPVHLLEAVTAVLTAARAFGEAGQPGRSKSHRSPPQAADAPEGR